MTEQKVSIIRAPGEASENSCQQTYKLFRTIFLLWVTCKLNLNRIEDKENAPTKLRPRLDYIIICEHVTNVSDRTKQTKWLPNYAIYRTN